MRAVPNFWFVTTTGLAEHHEDYKAVWLRRQPKAEAEAWSEFEKIEQEFKGVASAVMEAEIGAPIIGKEIPDERGDALAPAELLWEPAKVALTSRELMEDAGGRKPAAGWQVFELEALAGDAGPLITALKEAQASG